MQTPCKLYHAKGRRRALVQPEPVHDHSPIYRQADDSRIEEVLRRYQSGQQVDEYELIDAIGQRKGTKGINSDSSTWSKDIRIVLVAINPHPPTA